MLNLIRVVERTVNSESARENLSKSSYHSGLQLPQMRGLDKIISVVCSVFEYQWFYNEAWLLLLLYLLLEMAFTALLMYIIHCVKCFTFIIYFNLAATVQGRYNLPYFSKWWRHDPNLNILTPESLLLTTAQYVFFSSSTCVLILIVFNIHKLGARLPWLFFLLPLLILLSIFLSIQILLILQILVDACTLAWLL